MRLTRKTLIAQIVSHIPEVVHGPCCEPLYCWNQFLVCTVMVTCHDSMSDPFAYSRWTTRSVTTRSIRMCGEMILWRCGCTSDSPATLLRAWPFCVTLNWTGRKDCWLCCVSSVSDGHGGLPRGSDWPILSLPAADPHLPTSGQLWCTKGWGGGVWTEQGGWLLSFCYSLFIETVNSPYLSYCVCVFMLLLCVF